MLLEARGLSKSFGAVRVLHDVSFDVRPGEVLGILGPNGAGKTTLFNLISGDLKSDGGELVFAGQALRGEPPYRRCQMGIGRTYQVPRPYGGMTTFENLLVAASFGGGRSEARQLRPCARRSCETANCRTRPIARPGSLTLLDRKRLELARALASGPKLLLLDEIAGGLTDDEGKELVALIRRIRDRGVTIVWIEHVLHALLAVADRIMVLNFGEKIAEGAAAGRDQEPRGQARLHGDRGMSAPLLSTHGLVARYGDFQALYGVDFEIARRRDRGADRRQRRRQVDAAQIHHGASARGARTWCASTGARSAARSRTAWSPNGVAIVPEGRRLFTGMSVEDNLRVAIDHAARPRAGGWTLETVFDLFPMLKEMRATPVQSLSGGQQQMVAIGRALLNQPRLLLCDEISLGLAPKVVREIYQSIPSISADRHRHRSGRAGCGPRPVGLGPALLHARRPRHP